MSNNNLKFNLNVSIIREGETYIAYSPALDLSTCGDTYEQAKGRFEEAVDIFFEEVVKKGTLNQVLLNLGWQQKDRDWTPPVIVAQEHQVVSVPMSATM